MVWVIREAECFLFLFCFVCIVLFIFSCHNTAVTAKLERVKYPVSYQTLGLCGIFGAFLLFMRFFLLMNS